MRHFSLFFVLLMVIVLYGQSPQKTTIAVIDFEGKGISAIEASILANRLQSELVNTQAFLVIERGQMQSVLDEVGFQQSGCTSSECMVEIGRILNVQHMIGGSVGKFGNVYTLDLRMIDVGTAQIVETVTEDHEGKMTDLLKVMKDIAYRFAARQKKPAQPAREVPQTGNLEIVSSPSGAEIYVNEKKSGKTPQTLKKLNVGEYKIRLEKDGYVTFERTAVVVPGKKSEFAADLIALFDLQIISEPRGAEILIDGKLVGKTPYTGKQTAGKHAVKLVKSNYVDYEREVNLNRSGKFTAKLEMSPEYLARIRQTKAKQQEKEQPANVKEESAGGGSTWLWVGVGAAAVGGAAVLLLGGGDKGGGGDDGLTDLPPPPARPQ